MRSVLPLDNSIPIRSPKESIEADIADTRSSSIPPGKLAPKGRPSGVTSTAP